MTWKDVYLRKSTEYFGEVGKHELDREVSDNNLNGEKDWDDDSTETETKHKKRKQRRIKAKSKRDEENTKSENVNTNEPIRPEGSRVVQYQNLLNFQFVHGSPF